MTSPASNEQVLYTAHIKPLFRQKDKQSMQFVFDLWSYQDVKSHAAGILERLQEGSMPCDDPWPQEQVELFKRWVDSGMME